MNNQMTVKQLLKLCQEEVKKGNGDKFIVVADDNEGNVYTKIDCYSEWDVKS